MATGSTRPGRSLLIFAALVATMFGAVAFVGDWQPRLGLDLQGGTRITLTARTASGEGEVTEEKLQQAVQIINQRVASTVGGAEAEITTQGGTQIIVEIPGQQRKELVDLVGQTAQLRFRLVEQGPVPDAPVPAPTPTATPTSTPTPTDNGSDTPSPGPGEQTTATSRSARPAGVAPLAAPSDRPTASSAPGPTAEATGPPAPRPTADEPLAFQPSPQLLSQFAKFRCPKPGANDVVGRPAVDDPNKPLFACNRAGTLKYLLGPAAVEGRDLADAYAQIPPRSTAWAVFLEFGPRGSDQFAEITTALAGTGQTFAIVLDGVVLSAPTVNEPITNGDAQITGSFNQQSAQRLALALKYGALPLAFDPGVVTEEGPQLAGDQLSAGILAGLVGLGLVILYCLAYYRGLALVVVASLLVVGLVTYAAVLLLSAVAGFTLTLPGIAGLIVAIGITADSFIVYFERLRDEVREGKSLRTAAETGWRRARLTILAADGVSFLAALVLWIFAIGVVKGFAFALGLTTLIDVLVVFMFTKPIVTLLARTRFFGSGHPLSGLDPRHLGVQRLPGRGGGAGRRPALGEA